MHGFALLRSIGVFDLIESVLGLGVSLANRKNLRLEQPPNRHGEDLGYDVSDPDSALLNTRYLTGHHLPVIRQ